jgi:hypothetical protein
MFFLIKNFCNSDNPQESSDFTHLIGKRPKPLDFGKKLSLKLPIWEVKKQGLVQILGKTA